MDPSMAPEPPGGDQTRAPEMIAVRAVTTGIATVLISLRLYVRFGIVKAPYWDDLLIVLALGLSWAGFAILVVCTGQGLGRHVYYLELNDVISAVRLNYIGQVIIILSSMLTKLSICFFLLRLFATRTAWQRFFWGLMAFIFVTYVVAAALILPQCSPVARIWDTRIEGTCWPRRTIIGVIIFQGGIAIITDFILALLPAVFLWDVHIKRKHKIGISILMGMGIFTGICAIVRSIYVRSLDNTSDFTWTVSPLLIWSVLECNIAIIAATIPTLRVLFSKEIKDRFTYRSFSSYFSSRSRQSASTMHPYELRKPHARFRSDVSAQLRPDLGRGGYMTHIYSDMESSGPSKGSV